MFEHFDNSYVVTSSLGIKFTGLKSYMYTKDLTIMLNLKFPKQTVPLEIETSNPIIYVCTNP